MNAFKRMARFLRLLLFSFLFAMCMVTGVVPFIPKRKEEIAVEMKIDVEEKKEDNLLYQMKAGHDS